MGPLLFNIFIIDYFYLVKNTEIFWFENNYMKVNQDKSHLLVYGGKDGEISANISGSLLQESDEEKLLEEILDRRLNFKNHVSNLCKKASQKPHALARVSKNMRKS